MHTQPFRTICRIKPRPIPVPVAAPQPVVERMRDVLIDLRASNGGVTEDELLAQFSADEIRDHFATARKLADAKARRQ